MSELEIIAYWMIIITCIAWWFKQGWEISDKLNKEEKRRWCSDLLRTYGKK